MSVGQVCMILGPDFTLRSHSVRLVCKMEVETVSVGLRGQLTERVPANPSALATGKYRVGSATRPGKHLESLEWVWVYYTVCLPGPGLHLLKAQWAES